MDKLTEDCTKLDNLTEYYMSKLKSHKRMNVFLKYFSLPKHPILFVFVTTIISAEVELLTNIWIPSILAVYIMWEYYIKKSIRLDIAEECVADEMVAEDEFNDEFKLGDIMLNCPGLPLYVTEEIREEIVQDRVYSSSYMDMSIIKKIKKYPYGLIIIVLLYTIIFMALKFLQY